jgi:hypothetical protein
MLRDPATGGRQTELLLAVNRQTENSGRDRKPRPIRRVQGLSGSEMRTAYPIRLGVGAALLLLLVAAPANARWQAGQKGAPRRMMRQPPPPPRQQQPNMNAPRPQQRQEQRQELRQDQRVQRQGHLADWMQSHSNMSLAEQQRAMRNEPGFRELDAQTQQRELNRLAQLYSLSPQQRARRLDRLEAFESLNPAQRQQYDSAARQLYTLPRPRQNMIAHAMIDLREMPPQQREQVIDSPAFAQQFPDPGERSMIRSLLSAEPYSPAPPR